MKKILLPFLAAIALQLNAGTKDLYVFCGTGDNLWNTRVEPVDSAAAIQSMLEWMNQTYGISRLYWRAVYNWRHTQTSPLEPLTSDWNRWQYYLNDQFDLDRLAVNAAHKNNMEAFLYAGLLEHGLQPDAKSGYEFESPLRIAHPEWAGIDRWGERREPGPISFTYPEARRTLIDNYLSQIQNYGYDGINFYTYVENYGIRYEHEFGFEPAVVAMFNKKYPSVNLQSDSLTPEQAEYWYACRGEFVTQFLRELSAKLRANGKKLSVILDAAEPQYVQPWWGMPIRGTGKIKLDYPTWIAENLVDEIWVQLGDIADQQRTLDELLLLGKNKPLHLTVRTANPLSEEWQSYRERGVVPIAVITWQKNGIERYTRAPVNATTLNSNDWKIRAQTLRDAGEGKFTVNKVDTLKLLKDPNVLVRRHLYAALAAQSSNNPELIAVIEEGLKDSESSVRIGAALALQKANRPESINSLLQATAADPYFQLKFTVIDTLTAIGAAAQQELLIALDSPLPVVREIAIRSLYKLVVLKKLPDGNKIFASMLSRLTDKTETQENRIWAITQLTGMRMNLSVENQQKLIAELTRLVESNDEPVLQLKAAENLRYFVALFKTAAVRLRARVALKQLFTQYGDASTRFDAAYGWRRVGNTLRAFGADGIAVLQEFLNQRDDKFLAYSAYQVLYEVQDITNQNKGFNLIDEATAIANHDQYAPPFPGWRPW